MPKYRGKQIFAHGRFHEVAQKQNTEKKERRAKVGDNNGQATHGARKPPGPIFITSYFKFQLERPPQNYGYIPTFVPWMIFGNILEDKFSLCLLIYSIKCFLKTCFNKIEKGRRNLERTPQARVRQKRPVPPQEAIIGEPPWVEPTGSMPISPYVTTLNCESRQVAARSDME